MLLIMEWNLTVPDLKAAMIPAIINNNWSAVRGYIENMAPKDSVEYTQLQQIPINKNIIRESCSKGYTELLSFFMNKGFPVDYAVDERNEAMLHLAASEGHLSLVKLLLKSGANINRMSNYGESVVYSAVQKGHIDVVDYLLKSGADINKHFKYGCTVLHLAAGHENIPLIKLLIENGTDVNITNNNGETALHQAVKHMKIAVIKLLIEYGTDVSIIDKYGNNALYLAVLSGNMQVVQFLIEHGSPINIINTICQQTPLSLCIQHRNFEMAMLLISSGVDLNLCIYDRVLQKAIRASAPIHFIECLLEHGASVTAVHYDTALELVLSHTDYSNDCKLHIVKLLLIYCSDHYVEDYYGNTLLHLACEMGDVELVKYLIDYGLNVDSKNRQGKKPYDIAIEKGFNNIVKTIIHYHCNKYTSFD